jgi:hypothetical protein
MKLKRRLLIAGIGAVFLLIIVGLSHAFTRSPKVQIDYIVTRQFRTNDSIHILLAVTNSGNVPISGFSLRPMLQGFADGKWVEYQESPLTFVPRYHGWEQIHVHEVVRFEFAIPKSVTRFKFHSLAFPQGFRVRLRFFVVEFFLAHPSLLQSSIGDDFFQFIARQIDLDSGNSRTIFYSPEFQVDAPPLEPLLEP